MFAICQLLIVIQEIEEDNRNVECPMSISELGRSTWSLLHTMAAYYPDKPSERQKLEMSEFIKLFSKFYPCEYCAKDFRKKFVFFVLFVVCA